MARDTLHAEMTRARRWRAVAAFSVVAVVLAGCQSLPCGASRSNVDADLQRRANIGIASPLEGGVQHLPPGASLDDGLTEDEAISIALWNNAAFQETLADLGIARGDLIQAGLLPNPEFVYFWPVHQRSFKYLFDFPIESLWLRPIRIQIAAADADRATQRLVQAGLDLIRDVRGAYADLLLAHDRAKILADGVALRSKVSAFAQKRFRAGDISEQESATATIDARQAEQAANRTKADVAMAEERLRNLMGLGRVRDPLKIDPMAPPPLQEFDVKSLADDAQQTRPDALAAQHALEAADTRLKFARVGWVRLLGIGDATSGPRTHTFGPGLRFTVPIFHQNQGVIARAEAEREKADRARQTIADHILLEVERAYLQYRQARDELDFQLKKVRPEVEASVRRAQAGYQEGNTTIFFVLESTRQLFDDYLREAQVRADLRRARAELERAIGKRLSIQQATTGATEATSMRGESTAVHTEAAAVESNKVPGMAKTNPPEDAASAKGARARKRTSP